MGVDETWRERLSLQIDDLGPRGCKIRDLLVATYSCDEPILDENRLGDGEGVVHGQHGAVSEYERASACFLKERWLDRREEERER